MTTIKTAAVRLKLIGQYFSRVVTDYVPPPLALFLGALKSSSLNYVVIKFRLKIW